MYFPSSFLPLFILPQIPQNVYFPQFFNHFLIFIVYILSQNAFSFYVYASFPFFITAIFHFLWYDSVKGGYTYVQNVGQGLSG